MYLFQSIVKASSSVFTLSPWLFHETSQPLKRMKFYNKDEMQQSGPNFVGRPLRSVK